MCSIARRALVYTLAGPYVQTTLAAMLRNAGPYAAHDTACQLVRDHCGHWRDMLDATQYRAVELTDAALRSVRDIVRWNAAHRPSVEKGP